MEVAPSAGGLHRVYGEINVEVLPLPVRFTQRLLAVTSLGQQPDALCEAGREHGVDPLLGTLFRSQNLAKENQKKQVNTRKPA